mmetsp:Transcript_30863/g.43012  ORF Transcript_30863/g.43012 Transcript_30863/m.43012 type:complete len:218 (-) Transcript_30863:157-810(-)
MAVRHTTPPYLLIFVAVICAIVTLFECRQIYSQQIGLPITKYNARVTSPVWRITPSRRCTSMNARRKKMVDVLLKEDVKGSGKKGEITAVKPGFWRNYLLPNGIATQPTAEFMEQLRVEEEMKIAEAKAKKNTALKLRDGLQMLSFTIRMKAQDDGKLYGGVRPQDIVDAVKSQTGTELDPKTVDLPSMDKLDTYTVRVNLHPEVTASFPVSIQRGK